MIRDKLRVVFAFILIVIGIAGLLYCFLYTPWGWLGEYTFFNLRLIDFLLAGGSFLLFVAGLASFKRWGWYSREAFVAIALSVILSVALIYVTVVIPAVMDLFFWSQFDNPIIKFLTDNAFFDPTIRLLSHVSFAAMVVLIIVGFLVKRGKLSILGSTALYLPIFCNLVFPMSLLFGVGVLGFLWLPIYNSRVLSLGSIALLPNLFPLSSARYDLMVYAIYGYSLFVIMALGIALFLLGATIWLYGRFKGLQIINFGIYRYSRHPQYLGFLLWSYGLLLENTFSLSVGPKPRPSLLWLILALTTIGVALQEESGMVKKYGEKYLEYRNTTPFLFPIPKQVSKLIRAPLKVIFKKDWPENRKEIVCTMAIYGLTLILISALIIKLAEIFSILWYIL